MGERQQEREDVHVATQWQDGQSDNANELVAWAKEVWDARGTKEGGRRSKERKQYSKKRKRRE